MYSDNCSDSLTVGTVKANWGLSTTEDVAYVNFSYNSYKYFMVIDNNCDQEYIEGLLMSLIK